MSVTLGTVCKEKNSRALNAWFCLDAATPWRTARSVRNARTSESTRSLTAWAACRREWSGWFFEASLARKGARLPGDYGGC